MQNTWNWNPSIHESPEAIKRNPAALTAPACSRVPLEVRRKGADEAYVFGTPE